MKALLSASGLLGCATALLFSSCAPPPDKADYAVIMEEAAGTRPEPRWRDSKARKAVRSSFRMMIRFDSTHHTEIRKRFSRPALYDYFMRPESFIGGTFPRGTAVLLREVQEQNRVYIAMIESYPDVLNSRLTAAGISAADRRRIHKEYSEEYALCELPMIEALKKFDTFIGKAAEVYEFMAANSSSFKAMRTGLETTDERMHRTYTSLIDESNRAHDVADAAIRALEQRHQLHFTRMGVSKRVKS